MSRGLRTLLLVAVMMVITLVGIAAAPIAPNELSVAASSRRASVSSATVPAYAGNVTELTIEASIVTQGWQGYYGTVTGTVVLDDHLNQSMYTWNLTTVGEVYATRNSTTINWAAGNIICANITHIETEESSLNFNLDGNQDTDGINETFTYVTHPGFNVSTKGFESDECGYTVSTYVNDTAGRRDFNETLLYSNSDAGLIYASMLNDDVYGFNSSKWDFQMLVAEDGHSGDISSTTYYFYVELN